MDKPLYQNEKLFFRIALGISVLLWAFVVYKTKGAVLAFVPVMLLAYLFAQSGFISYLKGTGALVSDSQFPDIQERVKYCAEKTGLKAVPQVYILQANGVLNAFATRFLRKDYIVLLADILDALEDHPDAINFYIGHEMGHIDRKHLLYEPVLALGLVTPILGAAYSRAREYTCDMYGAACCAPESAQKGIALLSVGAKRYKTISAQSYLDQLRDTSGFWMSFHEIVASYPWLVKRFAHVSPGMAEKIPRLNVFSFIPALLVPRLSVMSAVVIYMALIFFSMSAAKTAEMKAAAARENQAGTASSASGGAPLQQMIDQVNKNVPQKIDEVTTLNGAHAEGPGTLVYDFSIAAKAETLDFAQMSQAVYANSAGYWCHNEATAALQQMKLKVIYRYTDMTGAKIGDVLIDTAACQ